MPPWLLLSVELVCVGVLLAGMAWLFGAPVAMIAGGLLGVVSCEAWSRR